MYIAPGICVLFCSTADWKYFCLFRSKNYAVSYARVRLETRAESHVGFLINCLVFFVRLEPKLE
jgi:hypothetical protein